MIDVSGDSVRQSQNALTITLTVTLNLSLTLTRNPNPVTLRTRDPSALFVLFSERVNMLNSLPVDTDFSSLARFIQQINSSDFSEFHYFIKCCSPVKLGLVLYLDFASFVLRFYQCNFAFGLLSGLTA